MKNLTSSLTTKTFLSTLIFASILGLSGCTDGPVENAGESVDDAIDTVKDSVDDACENITDENC